MSQKYVWTEDKIPQIDVHSIKKHDVLREYLKQYILVLSGKNPYRNNSLKITYIDAFSGGGIYELPNGKLYQGSPLIFLSATKEAAFQLTKEKKFQLKANYIFLEKQAASLEYLKNTLVKEGYADQFNRSIFFRNGVFEQHIAEIIKQICSRKGPARRCIFLLDQYGYADVPLHLIKNIFTKLPNAEVILTFYVDYLIDFLNDSELCRKSLRTTGICYNVNKIENLKNQKGWRSIIQHELFKDIVSKSGAKYFTNFFIKSSNSHKSYWLLHLSMHPTARNEMQKIHWNLKNHFSHEGKAGLSMLGYNPKYDGFGQRQDFLFSEEDELINHKALLSDIPSLIPKGKGLSLENLCISQCNYTPSTLEMINHAVMELYMGKEIRISTKNGRPKKLGAKLNPDDVLRLQDQLFFFE